MVVPALARAPPHRARWPATARRVCGLGGEVGSDHPVLVHVVTITRQRDLRQAWLAVAPGPGRPGWGVRRRPRAGSAPRPVLLPGARCGDRLRLGHTAGPAA